MERLLEILDTVAPGEDFVNCKTLIDDHILNSFAILSLVAALEEEYDIEVLPSELTPANFNSAEALYAMVQRLVDED